MYVYAAHCLVDKEGRSVVMVLMSRVLKVLSVCPSNKAAIVNAGLTPLLLYIVFVLFISLGNFC